MKLPKVLKNVIEGFEALPGIGPKTAQRLAFHMLRVPNEQVLRFSTALKELKEKTEICEDCYNVGDERLCQICQDFGRDKSVICVVESPLDVIAIEQSNYDGLYHVLHGIINPMAGIGPDEIFLPQLISRLKKLQSNNENKLKEIILATNTSVEGEATSMYIKEELRKFIDKNTKLTRIAVGLPVGADIEYADRTTLDNALKSRVVY